MSTPSYEGKKVIVADLANLLGCTCQNLLYRLGMGNFRHKTTPIDAQFAYEKLRTQFIRGLVARSLNKLLRTIEALAKDLQTSPSMVKALANLPQDAPNDTILSTQLTGIVRSLYKTEM